MLKSVPTAFRKCDFFLVDPGSPDSDRSEVSGDLNSRKMFSHANSWSISRCVAIWGGAVFVIYNWELEYMYCIVYYWLLYDSMPDV
jgi:hypothetical protein